MGRLAQQQFGLFRERSASLAYIARFLRRLKWVWDTQFGEGLESALVVELEEIFGKRNSSSYGKGREGRLNEVVWHF